jgi:hypothetical protein
VSVAQESSNYYCIMIGPRQGNFRFERRRIGDFRNVKIFRIGKVVLEKNT